MPGYTLGQEPVTALQRPGTSSCDEVAEDSSAGSTAEAVVCVGWVGRTGPWGRRLFFFRVCSVAL